MTTLSSGFHKVARMNVGTPRAFGWWSALTIFVSAFLLFQVQPMVSKMILPWFGGSPAVWSTCMLFFQIVLLAGYGYAHLTTRLFSPRRQVQIHGALLLMALLTLPIAPHAAWRPADGTYPALRILWVLGLSVGLPYFLVSSTGPLVQAWFSRMYPGHSPYRLYALSNIGSLGALVSYPFFFEPTFTLPQQDGLWSGGFGLFTLLNLSLAAYLWRFAASPETETAVEGATSDPTADPATHPTTATVNATVQPTNALPPTIATRVLWIVLPALASVALLAVTNHLSQDVAAVPFLWVLPLSLYLVTFILCFDSDRWYQRWLFTPAAMMSVLWFCFLGMIPSLDTIVNKVNARRDTAYAEARAEAVAAAFPQVLTDEELNTQVPRPARLLKASVALDQSMNVLARSVNGIARRFSERDLLPVFEFDGISHDPVYQGLFFLSFLFLGCMVCHGELARLRPAGKWLTEYFLLISAGGALGGVFVALVCPRIFTWYVELPLSQAGVFLVSGIALALLLGSRLDVSRHLRFFLAAAGLAAVGAVSGHSFGQRFEAEWIQILCPLLLAGVGCLLAWAVVATTSQRWQVAIASLGGLFLLSALFGVVVNGTVRKTEATLVAAERSFYGALQVKNDSATEPEYRWLTHGRISHGYQLLDPARRNTPNSYYAPRSGVGLAIRHHPRAGQLRVAVIGLGTATLAAYGEPGEVYRFYEIDDLVVRFSQQHFHYLEDSAATTEIVRGDARIQMERESPQRYDVIAVDAFSGDAIPVHLLTRQAMDVYLKHLQPDGLLVVHVSNRYLDLLPVVRGMAEYAKLELGVVDYVPSQIEKEVDKMTESKWVIVSNNASFWSHDDVRAALEPDEATPRVIHWTDDHSNLFEIFSH